LKSKLITYIIPTHNRLKYLLNLLECIENQIIPYGYVKKNIVVLDGYVDKTRPQILKKYPDTVIVEGDGSWWYTRSINEGFKRAIQLNADYVITMNDDTETNSDYLLNLINDYNKCDKDCIIGSITYSKTDSNKVLFAGIKKLNLIFLYNKKYSFIKNNNTYNNIINGLFESYELTGRGIFIPTKILKELNGFDNRFVQYGSDTDFSLRTRKSGYKVLISWSAKIYAHEKITGSGSAYLNESFCKCSKSAFNKYSANSLRTKFLLIKKHTSILTWPISFFIVIVKVFYGCFKKTRKK